MKLNEAIINIRVELQNTKLRKSGKNKFAGFEYYELSDFLPTLNVLMQKYGLNDMFSIHNESASLSLFKDDEAQTYEMPYTQFMTPTNKSGQPSMQDIQYLGALNTYYKRYLYLNAFGITDGEVIDSMPMPEVKAYQTASKATAQDRVQYKKEFISRASVYGLEMDMVKDYLSWLGIDVENENEVHNTIVKFLKSEDYLGEQVTMYIEYKRKHG